MHNSDYKQLKIWNKAIQLADNIYNDTRSFPKSEEYGLKIQMRRAAVSVPSNIAEGSQRSTDKDFANFISMAKGSLAELETQLILAQRADYISQETRTHRIAEIDELQKMLYSFYTTLKANS